MRYEIVDEQGRPLPPTLAGYRLKPGVDYRLRVETQDRQAQGWRLHVTPPPRFVERFSTDEIDGTARTFAIHTRSYTQGGLLQIFRNPAVRLTARLVFDDARQPYEFDVPVQLVGRWQYVPLLLGIGPFALPFSLPWRIAISIALVALLMLLWFVWDYLRLRKRARKLVAELQRDLAELPENPIQPL
jgi:hypothetical protein